MSAMPVVATIDEPAAPKTLGTIWQVEHQVRTAEEGDIDLFSNTTQTSDDWLVVSPDERVNLRYVANVWLTFGTIPNPDYRATLTGFDGCCVRLSGEPVVILQDELLKRVRRR
jgi:hypothetical protein